MNRIGGGVKIIKGYGVTDEGVHVSYVEVLYNDGLVIKVFKGRKYAQSVPVFKNGVMVGRLYREAQLLVRMPGKSIEMLVDGKIAQTIRSVIEVRFEPTPGGDIIETNDPMLQYLHDYVLSTLTAIPAQ